MQVAIAGLEVEELQDMSVEQWNLEPWKLQALEAAYTRNSDTPPDAWWLSDTGGLCVANFAAAPVLALFVRSAEPVYGYVMYNWNTTHIMISTGSTSVMCRDIVKM